jgi:hypothetical protein
VVAKIRNNYCPRFLLYPKIRLLLIEYRFLSKRRKTTALIMALDYSKRDFAQLPVIALADKFATEWLNRIAKLEAPLESLWEERKLSFCS